LGYEYSQAQDEDAFAGFSAGKAVFGSRDALINEMSLGASFVFNPNASFRIDGRYLRQTLIYNGLYDLLPDGSLVSVPGDASAYNLNFQSWNLDLRFSWWFAPASELVVLYRNSLLELNDRAESDLGSEMARLWSEPQNHNLSLRLVYFLDYSTVFRAQRPQMGNKAEL